jgi:uncharacterized protein YfaS (alpha-2-macroglobulin family)
MRTPLRSTLVAFCLAAAVPAAAATPAATAASGTRPAATPAATGARVGAGPLQPSSFSPQGRVDAVRQALARFPTPMVSLGDPRLPAPFAVACPVPGKGRWADDRNWVYDFDSDLPGGVRCTFTLRAGLVDLANRPVVAPRPFAFDTGGPDIEASLPFDGDANIDEEQVFLLRLDARAAPPSVAAHARCVVEGLAEALPVELIDGAERAAVLAGRRSLGYAYLQLLRKDGDDATVRPGDRALAEAEAGLVALRCARRLPPATAVQLVWGAGIASTGGIARSTDQRLTFRVRPEFTARVECARANAAAGCLPFKPIDVRFSAPVPRAQALGIRLAVGGQSLAPASPQGGTPLQTLESVRFEAPFPPSTRVAVTLPAVLVDDAGRPLANAARFPLEVRIDEFPPLAKFAAEFGIVEARAGGVLPVTLRNLDEPAAGAQAALPARRLRSGADAKSIGDWLRRVRGAMEGRGDWVKDPATGADRWRDSTGAASVFGPADGATAFQIAKPAGAREFEVVGIPLGEPGLHVVEIASRRLGRSLLGDERTRYVATAALVTNLAVHFKWGRESSLVWVTRLDDGTPVADADVSVSDFCDGTERWAGRTGRDGLARIASSLGEPQQGDWCGDDRSRRPLLVIAKQAGDFSFALSSWIQGIAPWDFGLETGGEWNRELAHTVFDRTLLRPGETVSMKHFLRRRVSQGLDVDPGSVGERKVVVAHQGSDQRYELKAAFDANGSAVQQWAIPPGARTGDYQVTIEDGRGQARESGRFKVEDFRLPTMRAEVSGPAAPQVRPSSVPLDLHVAYLSGGGAGGLPVTLRTFVEQRPAQFAGYDEWQFGGPAPRVGLETLGPGAFEADGESAAGAAATLPKTQVLPLTLDANGALRVAVGALPALDDPAVLTAELEYADANGERLTATGRVRLAPAGIAVGIRREGWVGTAESLRFKVVVLGLDGRPMPRQDVRVTLYRVQEYSYRKRLIGGFYAYENTRETTRLETTCAGRTDARGLLACEVAPGVDGQIALRAEARDAAGHTAGATSSMWVAGADDWWFGGTSGDRMDLLPEKQEYESGDRARFQVRMPFRKATALVTVEREGVLDGYVTTLGGARPVVTVPIAAAYAPNVFVSVLAVRGRTGRPDGRKLPPDQQVTALVDLNKPSYRLGSAAIRVGWKPHRLDVAVLPDRSVYGVRDRARVKVRVARADGGVLPAGSEVALAAVDEALLELAPNRSWQLLETMMNPRGIEVWTATAQMQVIGKRHYGRKAVPHGGGGGRDRARSSFDSLLLWQARLPLDANGEAVATVPLNDSLTAFRIVAVATASADRFGTGSATITSTQDLILLSGLPPVVREGDRYLATFTLRNTNGRGLEATVRASVTPGAALEPRRVALAPGAATDVTWTVVAPYDATKLAWDVRVETPDGKDGDRVQVSQQVIAAVPVRTYQATLAQLDGPLSVPVAIPAGAIAGRGGLEITLRARLADGLDAVRDWMRAYPYTCIEQNLSKAVALDDRKAWDLWMARLPAYLDDDGLLKYFPAASLRGEDALTAYVLALADASGYPIPEAERARMLAGLGAFVAGRIARDSALPTADLAIRKLAAVAALARHGAAEPALLDSLTLEPNAWPTSAVLDWIDILRRLPLKNAAARRDEAFGILRARLNFQGTTLGFSTERRDALWWLMVSTDSNAARLLLAVVDRADWKEDAPRVVRGLLGRQQRGHWNTTVANAWGVLALRRFSSVFEKTPVSGTTALGLGSARREVSWPSADATRTIALPWPESRETLAVTHSGTGRPWALVQTTAALPLAAPLGSGFTIERTLTPLEQRDPARLSQGDVVRVRLDLEAQSDMTWVVVDDPVPAGSSILGTGLGGQSERLTRDEARAGSVWPAFEERRFDAFRAYYRYVPKGRWTVEYTVRLNNPGTFQLPATRVEAMYAPEMLGERPNPPVTVAPR